MTVLRIMVTDGMIAAGGALPLASPNVSSALVLVTAVPDGRVAALFSAHPPIRAH